ncbi:MAG: hypothetical protein ISP90_16750 [Nevskia sp.]|nr:hypothetical protein [Nevskia sp.]
MFYALRGKEDKVSQLVAPGGRSSMAAAIINSGLVISLGVIAVSVLFGMGRLPPNSGYALAGFFTFPGLIGLTTWRAMHTRKSGTTLRERREKRISWIVHHRPGVFLGMALCWTLPMIVLEVVQARGLSFGRFLLVCLVTLLGGLLMATFFWFLGIRPVIDDYEYKNRTTNKRAKDERQQA